MKVQVLKNMWNSTRTLVGAATGLIQAKPIGGSPRLQVMPAMLRALCDRASPNDLPRVNCVKWVAFSVCPLRYWMRRNINIHAYTCLSPVDSQQYQRLEKNSSTCTSLPWREKSSLKTLMPCSMWTTPVIFDGTCLIRCWFSDLKWVSFLPVTIMKYICSFSFCMRSRVPEGSFENWE